MSTPKESDGESEETDFIKSPGVGVRWIYARRKDELNSLARAGEVRDVVTRIALADRSVWT